MPRILKRDYINIFIFQKFKTSPVQAQFKAGAKEEIFPCELQTFAYSNNLRSVIQHVFLILIHSVALKKKKKKQTPKPKTEKQTNKNKQSKPKPQTNHKKNKPKQIKQTKIIFITLVCNYGRKKQNSPHFVKNKPRCFYHCLQSTKKI